MEEHKDKSLHTVNLPAPEAMIEEFWNIINNLKKVSVNILSDKNVTVHEIDGNPLTGSYRRNGEGGYKCTKEEGANRNRIYKLK